MTKRLIWWFEELTGRDFPYVGKKIANLGEMLKAGIRISPGFGISVEANQRFFSSSNIYQKLEKYRKQLQDGDSRFLAEVSRESMEFIERTPMPTDLESEIVKNYHTLCGSCETSDVPVAVRSSGTISMPGQMETYLNIRGDRDLLVYVRRCWASSFSPEAISYRLKKGLDLIFPIGVGVQKMVNATVSGVMFTLNPLNGDRSKIYVEASYGLGEAVVSGAVTPDTFLVDRVTSEIIRRVVGLKEVQSVYKEEGSDIIFLPVEESAKQKLCLSDAELSELCKLGKAIDNYYGKPYDIEFAYDRDFNFPDNIFILQVRPESVWSKKEPPQILKQEKDTSKLIANLWGNFKA